MFEIRKAIPSDALGIIIVKAYTWKTTYTGLIPDELIDIKIKETFIMEDIFHIKI